MKQKRGCFKTILSYIQENFWKFQRIPYICLISSLAEASTFFSFYLKVEKYNLNIYVWLSLKEANSWIKLVLGQTHLPPKIVCLILKFFGGNAVPIPGIHNFQFLCFFRQKWNKKTKGQKFIKFILLKAISAAFHWL